MALSGANNEERTPAKIWLGKIRSHWNAVKLAASAVMLLWIFYATTAELRWMFARLPLPTLPVAALEPFRIANQYGLFAVMTRGRYEIEFQGSSDGQNWIAYPFRYKPQALNQPPRIYAPYQPRFDWNLWFASLGSWREYPIVLNTEVRLLSNSQDVLALFAANPFTKEPPYQIRAVLWQYWFTTMEEERATGTWWRREWLGLYAPTLEREADGQVSSSNYPRCSRGNNLLSERRVNRTNDAFQNGFAMKHNACVIGAGPNGLAAAIVLAQAGVRVDVLEAETTPGGGVRTLELTLPGFLHDFGSAVHPLGAGSPFFSSLRLSDYGLEWIHSPAPLAHPFDDGTAVVLERDLGDTKTALGIDGAAWANLMRPFVERWRDFAPEVLGPILSFPKHPLLMAQFGMSALLSARTIARRFRSERTRALFAGLAAHSFLSLNEPLSGAMGMLMAIPAHAVGWPIPRGGSQSLTTALCRYLSTFESTLKTSSRVGSLAPLSNYKLVLFDVTPRQLLKIAGERLSKSYKRELARFRYGPGAFKVDYALSAPMPWKASECLRAATVHLGGSFEEIAASEQAVRDGRHAEQPFVLFVQPSLFDSSRAPEGKHTAWAYCHVPNGSNLNMLARLESQIERFAPGFRDCVLARRVFSPADLESMDANLIGGDIAGGAMDMRQFLFRPTWRRYATSAPGIYICSASTPPGGGVHGMCGFNAARIALSRLGMR